MRFIIDIISQMHTITSANTIMNAAPPIAVVNTTIANNISVIINKIVNNIIYNTSFPQRNV